LEEGRRGGRTKQGKGEGGRKRGGRKKRTGAGKNAKNRQWRGKRAATGGGKGKEKKEKVLGKKRRLGRRRGKKKQRRKKEKSSPRAKARSHCGIDCKSWNVLQVRRERWKGKVAEKRKEKKGRK